MIFNHSMIINVKLVHISKIVVCVSWKLADENEITLREKYPWWGSPSWIIIPFDRSTSKSDVIRS